MNRPLMFIRAFDFRYFGTCRTCMRISFRAMVLSWPLSVGVQIFNLPGRDVLSEVSVAFTLLWIAHVINRANRSLGSNRPPIASRRAMLRTYLKGAVGAVAVSAFPSLVHADSGCGGWAGNSGCPPCTACQRQAVDCTCYDCRSCGENCTGQC
jgi:hypothetical protein